MIGFNLERTISTEETSEKQDLKSLSNLTVCVGGGGAVTCEDINLYNDTDMTGITRRK